VIFQGHVTGAVAAIATPNPIMQTLTTVLLSFSRRACSSTARNTRRRVYDTVLPSLSGPHAAGIIGAGSGGVIDGWRL